MQIGDIVKTSYNTGPYRIVRISGPHTGPSYEGALNLRDQAPPSKPHYNMIVVPQHIVIGKERPNDYGYLNGYEPSADPATWQRVWSDDELYVNRRGQRYPAATVLIKNSVPEEAIPMVYKAQFEIEDWFGPFEGWTDGRKWNGWACPVFEFDTAVHIMEAWNAVAFIGGEYEARYDAGKDEFCFRSGGSDWECFRAAAQDICGKRTTVYPIGAYGWSWSQAQEGPAP